MLRLAIVGTKSRATGQVGFRRGFLRGKSGGRRGGARRGSKNLEGGILLGRGEGGGSWSRAWLSSLLVLLSGCFVQRLFGGLFIRAANQWSGGSGSVCGLNCIGNRFWRSVRRIVMWRVKMLRRRSGRWGPTPFLLC